MALPAFQLDTPPAYPAARPGLLAAAVGPLPMPDHVQTSGAQWWADTCGSARLYPAACMTPPYPSFTADPADGLLTAYPFVVYASEVCPPIGQSTAEAEQRLRTRFQLAEQYAVEKALWGGSSSSGTVTGIFEQLEAAGKVTHLADSANAVEAVSLLEQQAAVVGYNGPLLIHARPRMSAYLGFRQQYRPDAKDGALYTWAGSRVVLGAGYSGNKWDGTVPTATAEAMYVTGRVIVWREEEVTYPPAEPLLDRTTNQRVLYAVRAYAVGVECLTAATVATRGGAIT